MPILDVQRRGQQIGRIRIGEQVGTGKTGKDGKEKTRPSRLSTFRFTTASQHSADAIAALYGGTVRDWEGQHEVITRESAISVAVPPRDQVVSQWYEMWSAGGCQRRCNSQHEQLSNGPCLCPHAKNPADEDEVARCALERADLARLNPPKACKLVTRISVMIPDLPGVGVFRLDTGSFYAATEIGDTAQILQMARDKGIFLPAVLRIEQRTRIADGQTKKYPVPVLEISATLRQITSGELERGGITAQLPAAPGEQPKAITAGTARSDLPGQSRREEARGVDPTAGMGADRVEPSGSQAVQPLHSEGLAGESDTEPWERATAVYRLAQAATTRAEVEALAAAAKDDGLGDEPVCIDPAKDEWQDLNSVLQDLWRERAA